MPTTGGIFKYTTYDTYKENVDCDKEDVDCDNEDVDCFTKDVDCYKEDVDCYNDNVTTAGIWVAVWRFTLCHKSLF